MYNQPQPNFSFEISRIKVDENDNNNDDNDDTSS